MKQSLKSLRPRRQGAAPFWQASLACTLMILLSSAQHAPCDETRYPMPERFSTSVIVGKRLKNPFASKLRLSQSKVANVVRDDTAKIEQMLRSKLAVGTTMFFGLQSHRNRAIINGKVRRPGDKVLAITEYNTEMSVRILEIRENGVVLRVPEMPNQRPLILPSEKGPSGAVQQS